MKLYLNLLLAVNLLTATAACKKEELTVLPEATQEGRGKAGFLLDGDVWLPQAHRLGSGTSVWATRHRTVVGHSLQVNCYRDSDRTNFSLFVPDIRQTGTFQLNQRAGFPLAAYGAYSRSTGNPYQYFFTGPTVTGTLTVTRFDTVARIASGTFEMTVQEIISSERHQLTDGRFDVQF